MASKVDEELKKNGLPSIAELKKEVDTSELEEKDDPLRIIAERLGGKLEHFITTLDHLIQPDSTFSNVHEYSTFNEAEKKRITDLYKRLMFLHRRYLEVTLDNDEKVSFIKEFVKEWQDLKKELAFVISKMKESWEKDSKLKIELGYLG